MSFCNSAPAPGGTCNAKPDSAGVMPRTSSGFSASRSSIFAPVASATSRRLIEWSSLTVSYCMAGSGSMCMPYSNGSLATIASAKMIGT